MMKKLFALLAMTFMGAALAQAPTLPKDIKWETNDKDPIFASPEAKRGGTYNDFIDSFPLTLRDVGPDSNGSFRSYLDANKMGLVELHPETLNWIPAIATHWAYGKDMKTVYFKINPKATWSDGKPVTAKDFAYTLEFMRSKDIIAPWYNNYYTEEINRVDIFDDHTFAVVGNKKKSKFEQMSSFSISPTPEHHFRPILNKDWTKNHNWDIVPNTGAYTISKDGVKKGKHIIFKRNKNWWANDLKYFQYRNNYDAIKLTVIRDMNLALEYFKKGQLDTFQLVLPVFWHGKAKGKEFDNGYIHRIWFYNQTPQPEMGVWINSAKWPFEDQNVREAFAHALNVDKLIEQVLRGDYERLHRFASGTGKFDDTKIKARDFDLEKVKQFMTKAGWTRDQETGIWKNKEGRLFKVEMTYGSPMHTDRVVVLKEEAKKAGIDIELKLLDGAAAFKTVLEKQHTVAWTGLSAGLIPSYWQCFHSENANKPQTNNFTNTADKELDKLIDSYDNEFDDAKKQALSKKIQRRIHELSQFIPTTAVPYAREGYWAWIKYPSKLPKTMGSVTGSDTAWIDQDVQKAVLAAKKAGKKYSEPVTIINTEYKIK